MSKGGDALSFEQRVQQQVQRTLAGMSPDQLRALASRGTADDRRARYEHERAERLKKVVLVKFERAFMNYNVGEVAGLEPKLAHMAIEEGFARRVSGAQPIAEPVRVSEQARDIERAQASHVAKLIPALDEDDPEHFGEDGLPSVAKLSRLAGFDVTPEQRDEAWAKHQAQQNERGV